MELQHEELEELLGAYALDAVDDDERAAVEAHLATCPRCRAEVDAHREVASHLAQTGAPAPDGLWDRIVGAIDEAEPPPLRLVATSPSPAPTPAPTPRRPWWQRSAVAAAAAVVVAVGLVSAGVAMGGDDGGDGGVAQEAIDALQSPSARVAELVAEDGTVLARAAVLENGHGYLLAGALPDLDERIYQLWGSDGDSVVSLGTMGAAPQVVEFMADPTQTTLMVTEEDEPVERSSNPPVVVGELA
jgi:anti-sigma factor RsiW